MSADIQRQYLAITHTLLQKGEYWSKDTIQYTPSFSIIYLLCPGLTLLAQVVRTATEQVLINHSLKHQLTLAQVQDLLNGILEQVSLSAGGHRSVWCCWGVWAELAISLRFLLRSGRHTWLLQFVLPPDSPLERVC